LNPRKFNLFRKWNWKIAKDFIDVTIIVNVLKNFAENRKPPQTILLQVWFWQWCITLGTTNKIRRVSHNGHNRTRATVTAIDDSPRNLFLEFPCVEISLLRVQYPPNGHTLYARYPGSNLGLEVEYFWQRFFVLFLIRFRQTPGKRLKLDNNRFSPNPFQFVT
jgi:hypothetical protein